MDTSKECQVQRVRFEPESIFRTAHGRRSKQTSFSEIGLPGIDFFCSRASSKHPRDSSYDSQGVDFELRRDER